MQLSTTAQNWTHRKAHANITRAVPRPYDGCPCPSLDLATVLVLHIDYDLYGVNVWFDGWWGIAG